MFFTGKLTDEAQRAKADYWDVWSGIFKNSFFGEQADWCAKYNVDYLVHLATKRPWRHWFAVRATSSETCVKCRCPESIT